MSYWIVHILRFALICDLPACHIGALKMKKSSLMHSTKGFALIKLKLFPLQISSYIYIGHMIWKKKTKKQKKRYMYVNSEYVTTCS
jgi:hypothetical protein